MEFEGEKQTTVSGTRTHTIKERGHPGPGTGTGKARLPAFTSHPDDTWEPEPSY